MTKAAKEFGKELQVFLRREDVREYTQELEKVVEKSYLVSDTDKSQLIIVQRGNGNLPQVGTWAHPKLAVFFARWLDTRFAVACDAMSIIKNFQSKELLKVLYIIPKHYVELKSVCRNIPSLLHVIII